MRINPVRIRPWTWPRRAAGAALRAARRLFLGVGRWLRAQGRAIKASPLAFYQMLGRRRDALVAKIEYVHTESAKWRAMWSAIKAPYSALRYFGLSPQMGYRTPSTRRQRIGWRRRERNGVRGEVVFTR